MLHTLKDLEGFKVTGSDGLIGPVKDLYFDDAAWVIRYLVVESGEGTAARDILISPIAIGQPNWAEQLLPVDLTVDQAAHSPDIELHKPVSRQQEMGYLGYFGYGQYWGGGGLWGAGMYPDVLQAGRELPARSHARAPQGADSHLRSWNAVSRYYVHATDGDIGHVEAMLLEERTYAIRYLVVNTSNWWLGHAVLIAPAWIDHISWAESMVYFDVDRQAVKDSPPFLNTKALEPEQETRLHQHYGRVEKPPRHRAAPGSGS
jgi:hypothetical protein